MSPCEPKIQRWTDLIAALLRRHYPATFEDLARDVPGYGGDRKKDAVMRMWSVTIEHPLASVEWGVRHVPQYGPEAELIEPASLREDIGARLRSIGERQKWEK